MDNVLEQLGDISKKDTALITKAYHFAKEAHKGQLRYSGEPYFNHAVRTALNLVEFKVDTTTIVAGLLHDVFEDCDVPLEKLEKEFGKVIPSLVWGTSKLGSIHYHGREQYAENMRHLFIAVAHDIRVLLIKLADRLDNIRTLEYVPQEKQQRIALETLEIYASVANRLGMGKVRAELQERSFPYAYPEEYKKVSTLITEKAKEREKYIKKVYKSLSKKLVKEKIENVIVDYRIKDTYSIYKKLLKSDMDVAKIYDLYALRVIVPRVEDCYRVLGFIHNLWKPLPTRIKDYIANPKINGYQSLHTTVFTGDGGIAEIQVRTQQMHIDAEYGIAAHMSYKGERIGKTPTERLDWLSRIQELHKETGENEEFLSNLKLDFFEKRIFVFTPKGDVIELPENATALDFAYAIHSQVGNQTQGTKVNGKFVSLDTPLKNSDIVEIQTNKNSRPTHKWYDYVKTGFARRYIKNYLTKNKS